MSRKYLEDAHRDAWRRGHLGRLTVRLLGGMAVLIVLTETFAMALIEFFWPGGFWTKTLFDEALLVGVTLPALYFAMFRPLLRLLAERRRSEEALAFRAREMAARDAVSTAALREPKVDGLFSGVIDVVISLFGADGGWVLLLEQGAKSGPRILGLRGVSPFLLEPLPTERCLESPTCCDRPLDWLPQGEITFVTECRHVPRDVLMAAGFGGYVGVPLPAGRRIRACLNLVWKSPRTLDDADRVLLRAIARNIEIAADSAALYEAEQRARQAADMIRSATLALNQTLELDAVLRTLFEQLRRMVPYDRAKVMLLEGGNRLKVQAVFSPPWSQETSRSMPATFDVHRNPLLREVLESGKSVSVPDLTKHLASDFPTQTETEKSWLGVPLLAEGQAIGLVTLVKEEADSYEPELIRLVEAMAAAASVAIANARMFGEVQSGRMRLETLSRKLVEARETEGRHLARELHDEIGQSLTAVLYRLQAAQCPAGSQARGALDEAIEITDRTIKAVRDLSLDLRPSLLDDAGLAESLRWYIDRQVRSDTLDVALSVSPESAYLPLDIRNACFRIVQEALTNVIRHAGARRVQVQIRSSGSLTEIAVWDDGRGFDVEEAHRRARSGGSFGILGMQERAELLGGKLVFESKPGVGTTVKASIPFSEPD